MIREVHIRRTTNLRAYRALDSLEAEIEDLEQLGRRVRRALGPQRVWMLSSTEIGGGVAEMLPRLCSLLNDLGVHTRWLVLSPDDPRFFQVTKGIHNLLHGEPGLEDEEQARRIYDELSERAAVALRERVQHGDLLVVHDPQPLGAAAFIEKDLCPRLVWRCHVGTAHRNANTDKGWTFLAKYLQPFSRCLFSAEQYIPDDLRSRSGVLFPGIDPLSHKNRELRSYKLIGVLRAAGLAEGPELPAWARFEEKAQRFVDGRWMVSPIPGVLFKPLIVQVSRFDRLKGYQHLMPAFEHLLTHGPHRAAHLKVDTDRVLNELGDVELVLAGPEPEGVVDDPEAGLVLEELCRQHAALPELVRQRVHLLRLPMKNPKQNALTVNALQRIAAVIAQVSTKEGFGLTVSEALWKLTPVVASNVGGLGIQIRDHTDGLLVDDPSDPVELSEALLHMLAYPKDAELMARSGRRRVARHFLVSKHVHGWLEEAAGSLGIVPAAEVGAEESLM